MNAIAELPSFQMQELTATELDEVSGGIPQVVIVGAVVAGGLLAIVAVGFVVGLGIAYAVTHR